MESMQDDINLYMLLEYLPGGELYKQIRKKMYMNEQDSQFYLAEIVLGIETLHNMGIIYRDLKPENILIDKEGHVKLIDFGFAKKIAKIYKDKAYTNCGTPGYCAPEVMMEIGHTFKADIWSIGILICEIMGGFTPFENKHEANNPRAIMEKCRNGKLNLPKNLHGNSRDLIKLLLVEDPH
jgi:serine/threonine protein kinase